MLLSADCRDTFLCDFGLSEMLDDSRKTTKAFRGELMLKHLQEAEAQFASLKKFRALCIHLENV